VAVKSGIIYFAAPILIRVTVQCPASPCEDQQKGSKFESIVIFMPEGE
jgi:hypothetical protein